MVSFTPFPTCPACGRGAFADDRFCESCGAPVAAPRQTVREHIEIDCGVAAGVSDLGLVHRINEDAIFVVVRENEAVVVVADGVSTSSGADVAAQVAVEAAGERLCKALTARDCRPDATAMLDDAIHAAHAAVAALGWIPVASRDAPSCTLVAALWDGDAVTVGWAGDSRAYWVGTGGPTLLTNDHSWVQEQVDAGAMTPDEAGRDRRGHVITRWLGNDAPAAPTSIASFRPNGPGRLILCTDGLWNYMPSPVDVDCAVSRLASGAMPLEVAQALTRVALRCGGRDNVSVAVLDITMDDIHIEEEQK